MTFKASLASLLVATTTFAADSAPALSSEKDRVSYAIGTDIGNSLKRMEAEIDPAKLAAGLNDALGGGKLLLTEEEIASTMQAFQMKAREKMMAKRQADGEKLSKEGVEFLEANKKKEGVVVLPSGLQYKVIKMGEGVKPTTANSVVAHYRGTLINGKEFDSSYKRNEPATFPVTGVIPGWTEVLQLMPTGSKWQVYIPSALAYGEGGAGADIPPNSTLIFDIELIEVK